MKKQLESETAHILQTGVPGLDEVLKGGLAANRLYLVEGHPGSGKTTLALQFLREGVAQGERCLFVSLSESRQELEASAASHGWTLDGIAVLEIIASEESLKPDSRYTMFHPSEVELAETTKYVLAEAEKIKPSRMVFDSLSELRLLAENPLRYRRQILALKHHFSRNDCTVWFIDDRTSDEKDMHLHSLAHGVISLEAESPEYGTTRRRMRVGKMRGHAFREGYHDFAIHHGGVQVFPRLVAAEHRRSYARQTIKGELKEFNTLLGGGLAKGTSTLILGAAGTGKSTLATQYACAVAARGERAAIFLFDETIATFLERSSGLGLKVEPLVESGRLTVQQIDPAELSPGEFTHAVRQAVEKDKSTFVVIDSLTGFLNAIPSERYLVLHLHELLTYLGQQGVTTLLLMTQHGIVGKGADVPIDTSYLADAVVYLRYFEAYGEVRQAISVIKKRTGKHERTIRELRFDKTLTIGEPIREFHGVLSGAPQLVESSPNVGNAGQ